MRLGVRHKLVLLSVVIIVGVSFGFPALNVWLASRWVEEDVQRRVVAFGRVLAASISSRQELESHAALEPQVRQILAAREDLLQLDVLALRADRTDVVASSRPDQRLPFTRRDVAEVLKGRVVSRLGDGATGRHWDVMAPITLDAVVSGAVAARFSSASVDRLTSRLRAWALLVTGASVVVMGILMSVAVRYVVDRPVRRFLGAIARIQGGDRLARVDVGTADEFGLLAEHFNAMMARIQRFSDELRIRVEEATGELDQRYQQVQRLNAQLYELQRRLTHAERLAVAGRIMAEVAHEVGTPLHSVAGHLELLRRDLPAVQMTGEVERRLTIVETQVARVIEIIATLLDLTRRQAEEPRAIDMNQLAHQTVELLRPGVSAAGVTLEVAATSGPALVSGSVNELQQVILSLLTNAADATPPGGRVSVATRALIDRDEVELTVDDTGRGIPPAVQPRIFDPFFSTKPPGRGSGLGLFIAGQIVRDHKGRIEFTSAPDRGTTFRVYLPATTDRAA